MFDFILVAIAAVFMSLLFQLVTLPVEFDASKRAMNQLDKLSLVNKKEHDGAQATLKAAAWTYVAAVLSSMINLLRLLRYVDRD